MPLTFVNTTTAEPSARDFRRDDAGFHFIGAIFADFSSAPVMQGRARMQAAAEKLRCFLQLRRSGAFEGVKMITSALPSPSSLYSGRVIASSRTIVGHFC